MGASWKAEDYEANGESSPFLFDPHEFTLTCRELQHRCVHQAKGLMILKNECYKSPTQEDIQHIITKKEGKKSKHLYTAYHVCKYYTCRTFAEECKLNARNRYITTLTCEHHYNHQRELRYLIDMRCEYMDTCAHRKQQCKQNKNGWNVKVNECTEQIIAKNEFNQSTLHYNEQCEYKEPTQWKFDNDLAAYLDDMDPFDLSIKMN